MELTPSLVITLDILSSGQVQHVFIFDNEDFFTFTITVFNSHFQSTICFSNLAFLYYYFVPATIETFAIKSLFAPK